MNKFYWACFIGSVLFFNDMANAFSEDVFITRTGRRYYAAGSPFIKTRVMIRIDKKEAESKGYKPSRSYLKARSKEKKDEKVRFFEENHQ